jgi:hypothetical protein
LEAKSDLLIFFAESKKIALGKEIFDECFFLCRELNKKLSAKPSLPRVFYLALGTEPDSRQRLKFR